jgi:hypothetical protein
MRQDNRQYLDVVDLLLVGDHLCQGSAQVEFAQLQFDRHFPGIGHTE